MTRKVWLLCVIFAVIVSRKKIHGDENISNAIRSLQEQVNALLDHRQQDYNALEASLKRAIEKNTELFVLKNEIKQLRKEVIFLRGGNGNEAKNERLRVRWLGSAVTELKGEIAEVLRTRNVSEELAERSRMKGELALMKGDIAAVGKGVRNLGGRIAKIEAVLGMIRVDIAAVKERFSILFRTCADIASQLNSIQIEVKSFKCESSLVNAANSAIPHRGGAEGERGEEEGTTTMATIVAMAEVSSQFNGMTIKHNNRTGAAVTLRSVPRHRLVRKHGYSKRSEEHRIRLDDRLRNLERKMILTTQRQVSLEKRIDIVYENQEWLDLNKRIKNLEKTQDELPGKILNASENTILTKDIDESLGSRLIGSLRNLEDTVETNSSFTKRELLRLSVDAVRKAAELSLTRVELNNLRRTVQALSVSASKLQERSDRREKVIDQINGIYLTANFHRLSSADTTSTSKSSSDAFLNFNQLKNRYYLVGYNLTGDCERKTANNEPTDALRLLRATEKEKKPMLAFCREGWIVISRRIDGTLDFDRNWNDYSLGFGSPFGEYWIGNAILHKLTRDNCTSLRIDMLDIYGERWRAEYESFKVESVETGYRLSVYGYSGNATDAFSYQNGMAFSARDRDMDASATNCARNYHGGWWFNRCQHANLNGKYSLGLTWFRSDTNKWMSIAFSEMSVRRNPICRLR
ncbi:PREDICTED: protein scabrous-like [Eufriesea mexicana]|uniref:protein scabrous-like n=1 Tax=Eufriesea mexicana TaxID=516756 RepID=UPI00083C7420|nr:PREDICTED: protein scabrous-like [Eufriesea mexicana]